MSKQARREKNLSTPRIIRGISGFLLTIYIAVLFWQTFIQAYGFYNRVPQALIEYNLLPFKTIEHYLRNFNGLNINVWFFNLFGERDCFYPIWFFTA